MVPSRLTVRNYSERDLPEILSLYNCTSTRSPSFIRDEHFWKHFTNYPGVNEDSIFVAVEDEKIMGLAIACVSDEGGLRQGNILDIQAKDASGVDCIIQAAIDYFAGKDVDMIAVAPPAYLDTGRIFTDWFRFERTVMMCKPLSILPLLHALLNKETIKNSYAGKEFSFIISSEIIQIRVTTQTIKATQLNTASNNYLAISVSMSSKTLLEIAFGVLNPYVAYLTRRVKIDGLKSVPMILKLLRIMKLDTLWSIALVDVV